MLVTKRLALKRLSYFTQSESCARQGIVTLVASRVARMYLFMALLLYVLLLTFYIYPTLQGAFLYRTSAQVEDCT